MNSVPSQSTWLKSISHTLQQLSPESGFSKAFQQRLSQAYQDLIQQNTLPIESQKAFLHAFQLYTPQKAQRLIQYYDPQKNEKLLGASAIRKMWHSSLVIPKIQEHAYSNKETQEIQAYLRKLQYYLCHSLGCSSKELRDPHVIEEALQSFESPNQNNPILNNILSQGLLDLLFHSGYFVYLCLKNRFLMQHVLRGCQNSDVKEWTHNWYIDHRIPVQHTLESTCSGLSFEQMEQLAQSLLEMAEQTPSLQSFAQPLRQIKNPLSDSGWLSPTEDVFELASTEIPLEPVPSAAFERTPFEMLCFQYAGELIYLAKHTQMVHECSSPYFLAKSEDYSDAPRGTDLFLSPSPSLTQDLKQFIQKLLEITQPQNPFPPLLEETAGSFKKREWGMLFQSQTPIVLPLSVDRGVATVQKGRKFVLHLGLAAFEQSSFQMEPFLKVLIRGHQPRPRYSLVYVNQMPFYALPVEDLEKIHGLVALQLMTLRAHYDVEIPNGLKAHLVQHVPTWV